MIYLRRIFMVGAALVAINMQGCGCDDNDDKYYPPPQNQNYTVTGTAGKGVLSGFTVDAHRFEGNEVFSTPIATATTNSSGHYSLSIPDDYLNFPIVLRVTPGSNNPTMRCDLSTGCGTGVNFGDNMPVTDSTFTLETVLPTAADNSVANVTLLTTLAAQHALAALDAGATVADIRQAIDAANSSIANRFGIPGDLATMPFIDLTDAAAVRAAMQAGNSAYVQYAAVNAAIVQAVRVDKNTLSFIAALNDFTSYYAGGGIASNTTDATETSLADILAAARAVLMQVQANDPEAPEGLAGLLQSLFVDQQLAESEPADDRSPGTPSDSAGKTPIEKVKAMVADLRNLGASVGNTALGDGTIGAISEDFGMQLEAAEMAASENAGALIEAMATAAAAIDDANRAHSNNAQLTTYTSDTGVSVAIDANEETTVFSVDQDIDVETDNGGVSIAVVLGATDTLTFGETETATSAGMTADGSYALTGTAESAALRMTVKEGSSLAVEEMAVVESADTETAQLSETNSLNKFDLNLIIELMQLEAVDPVTLEGTLIASLADVVIVESDSATSETETSSLGAVSLRLSGVVRNDSGESATFALSVSGDGTGVSFVDTWTQQGETSTGETADNFVDMYGSLAFTAQLTGNPNVVSMNYSVARTGLEDADNSLSIRYPGKQFRFNMLVADGAPQGNLTISNQDGVIMRLMETTVQGESRLQGTITLDGTQYATVEEDDIVVIRYADESYESI